jgi:2-amino-4-hydroxy-6-hydroxymethyldihydropteridine diphosphokinase
MLLIALGSNLRHPIHGAPRLVLAAACRALDGAGIAVTARSSVWLTSPVGPRQPRYANAVVCAQTSLEPLALLRRLKAIERDFGRKTAPRWSSRVLDLDILDYDNRCLQSNSLVLPHPGLDRRSFVLLPLMQVAPRWCHPVTRLKPAHLLARLAGPRRGMVHAGFL